MKYNSFYRESAVSPVIGVLLMLVVTIIIAAVVSGFAGGLAGTQQKAPQASFDVKTQYPINSNGISANLNGFDIMFTHKGGDTISTKNTQIITYLTLPNGSVVQHKQSPTSSPVWSGSTTTPRYVRYPYFRDSMGSASQSLTLAQVQAGETSPVWFGELAISTGASMRVSSLAGTAAFLGLVDATKLVPYDTAAYQTGMDLLNQSISNKTRLDVKMLDIPSQKYIFEKSMNLEG